MLVIQNNSKYDGGGGNYVSSRSANILGYKYLNEIYVKQIIQIGHCLGLAGALSHAYCVHLASQL